MATIKQEGGKLLGQGVYGCAFDPPLECSTTQGESVKTKGHNVGKITSKEDAEKEFAISQHLQSIPKAEDYFVLIHSVCTPKPRAQQRETELPLCEPLQGVRLNTTKQLIMPFGGKPLRMLPMRVSSIDIYAIAKQILEGLTLLLTKRTIHDDLHAMNVLLDSPQTCRLIDFGLAWRQDSLTLANLQNLYRTFNPGIAQEPPEICVLQGYLDNMPLDLILAHIEDEKLPLKLVEQIFHIPVKQQVLRLQNFLYTSASFSKKDQLACYAVYWSKIDAWGAGCLLLSHYALLQADPAFFDIPKGKVLSKRLLDVCKHLLDMDAGLRWDAAEALRAFAPDSAVLARPEVQQWLEEQDALRGQLQKIVLDAD